MQNVLQKSTCISITIYEQKDYSDPNDCHLGCKGAILLYIDPLFL